MISVLRRGDARAVADTAARIIAEQVRARPETVLGLATGQTQELVYARLAALRAAGEVSFGKVAFFSLDEYLGLGADHPASFNAFLHRHFYDRVDADPARIDRLDGTAIDGQAEAARYEGAIAAAGGIDLQLLGIGTNGHIAFNEPMSDFRSRTRVVALEPSTVERNSAFFGASERVPLHALTMGIGTILDSGAALLVAVGKDKAISLRAMIEGPIDPRCPASALRLHPRVTVVCDADAASLLTKP
jgi:glucosamine-6-phosphate deaminase